MAQLESGHTPSRKHGEYWDGDIPWIGIKDAVENHGRTIWGTYQHVTPLGLDNSSARLLPAGTVCLSRTASIGYVVVMGRPMATSQDFINWVCGPRLDPQFLKYVLLAENEALFRFASGTTHQTIYYPEAKAFHVCMPPISVQRRIAHILGTLDDKIELNRKMNQTLEAMARALFKSWFVDFDPVRAKAEGRRPASMDAATAALFPDAFQDSPLGKIPKGWRTSRIGDASRRVAMGPFGSNIKRNNFVSTGVPVIRGGNLTDGFVDDGFVFVSESKADELRNSVANRGDIVITHRGTLGQVGLIPQRSMFHRYVVSQSQMLIAVDPLAWSAYFAYYYLTSGFGQHCLLANTSQTGVPAIARPTQSVKAIPFVMPRTDVLRCFDRIVDRITSQAETLKGQVRDLISIRDTLLPKLLEGVIPALGVQADDALSSGLGTGR